MNEQINVKHTKMRCRRLLFVFVNFGMLVRMKVSMNECIVLYTHTTQIVQKCHKSKIHKQLHPCFLVATIIEDLFETEKMCVVWVGQRRYTTPRMKESFNPPKLSFHPDSIDDEASAPSWIANPSPR